ncbi:MAG: DUF4091 domain-containing protein [Chloroflexi bacterium]|nr:DUF4091 domain-containing protein [Chloroflexota bacterium]
MKRAMLWYFPLFLLLALVTQIATAAWADVALATAGAPCTLPQDLDGSGLVDMNDLMLIVAHWHHPLDDPRYDFNGDSQVDVVDVMAVATHWGDTGTPLPGLPNGGQVWVAGSTRKIRPTDAPRPTTWVWDGCRVRLKAAQGETEAFQIVLRAGTQPLTGVTVSAGDLTGSSNTISQSQITFYREAYYTVTASSDPYGYGLPAGALEPGPIPDALIPFDDPYSPGHAVGAPFTIPAGQNRPVWIDVAVPATTPAGTYSDQITMTTDLGTLVIPLELRVWDFSLPARPSLFINYTLDPFWTLPPQYEVPETNKAAIHALTDKHYEALWSHRQGPIALYLEPSVSETGGQVQIDWSQADPLYAYWLDTKGLPAVYAPDIYDSGNDVYRIRDASGNPYTQANFSDPTFVQKAQQYYAAVRDHLQSKGWWDRTYIYPTDETEWVADEPEHNGPAGFQRLQAWGNLLHIVDPAYRINGSSVYPVPFGDPSRGWPTMIGVVSNWDVVVQDADEDPASFRRRLEAGDQLFFYLNDWGDFLDYKATLHRGLGWVTYKYDAWGLDEWAGAAWIGDAATMDIVNPWTSPVTSLYGLGGGALFWPGHHIEGDPNKNVDGPLPSIRLKLGREAVDDHDYLTLLATQTSPEYAHALAQGLIAGDYWDWNPTPEKVYAWRDHVGAILDGTTTLQLATVRGQVTDAANSAPIAGAFVTDGWSGARSDAGGVYTLTVGLPTVQAMTPASSMTLTVSAPRFVTQTVPALPQANQTVTQNVSLTHVTETSTLLYSFESVDELDWWEFASTLSFQIVPDHATDGGRALKVVFDDDLAQAQAGDEAEAATGTFPTADWSHYTALEFDVYNESDFYTMLTVSVGDNADGWYPLTGGEIKLLPRSTRHVILPMAEVAASVDLTHVIWLSIGPETVTQQTDYQNNDHFWRLGPRTLYLDNLRLVSVK